MKNIKSFYYRFQLNKCSIKCEWTFNEEYVEEVKKKKDIWLQFMTKYMLHYKLQWRVWIV